MKVNTTILIIAFLTVIEIYVTNGIWGGVALFVGYGVYKSFPQIVNALKDFFGGH
jgi:hypothetical protein